MGVASFKRSICFCFLKAKRTPQRASGWCWTFWDSLLHLRCASKASVYRLPARVITTARSWALSQRCSTSTWWAGWAQTWVFFPRNKVPETWYTKSMYETETTTPEMLNHVRVKKQTNKRFRWSEFLFPLNIFPNRNFDLRKSNLRKWA